MALMFPRLARNFARNGYFPTDEVTLERALQALAPAPSGRMRICDPCAGEGLPWLRQHTPSAATRSKPSLSSTTASAPTMLEACLTECCTVTFSTP